MWELLGGNYLGRSWERGNRTVPAAGPGARESKRDGQPLAFAMNLRRSLFTLPSSHRHELMVGAFGDVVPRAHQRLKLREGRVHLPGHGGLGGGRAHARPTTGGCRPRRPRGAGLVQARAKTLPHACSRALDLARTTG